MQNKNLSRAIFTLAMIFAMAVAGYGQNNSIDGIWLDGNGFELKMNNGSFELELYEESLETGHAQITKGNFTIGNGELSVTYTHYHGYFLCELGLSIMGIMPGRWYSLDDIKTVINRSPLGELASLLMMPQIEPLFVTETVPFSGNSIILMWGSFNRKN